MRHRATALALALASAALLLRSHHAGGGPAAAVAAVGGGGRHLAESAARSKGLQAAARPQPAQASVAAQEATVVPSARATGLAALPVATAVPLPLPAPAVPTAVASGHDAEMPAAKRAAVAQLTAGATPAAAPAADADPRGGLPPGSYFDSCRDCTFDKPLLRCGMCENGARGCRNGDFSGCTGGAAQLDLSGCDAGRVENNHGALACGAVRSASAPASSRHVMGSDLTYAQNYQDTWVVRLAAANGWVGRPGFFLDLGAFNGVYCSNSKLLVSPSSSIVPAAEKVAGKHSASRSQEDLLGWGGVCVEPFPTHSFEGGNFAQRRCLLVDRALTGSLDGQTVAMEGDGTDQSTSLDLDKAKAAAAGGGGGGSGEGKWVTTTISITSLLDCVNGTRPCNALPPPGKEGAEDKRLPTFINFVSMDVEGLEYDVLQSWPFDKVSVGAWIVEHNNEEPKRANVIALLKRAQSLSLASRQLRRSFPSSTRSVVRALVLSRARLHALRGGERGGGRLLRRPEVLAPGAGGQGLARPSERLARLLIVVDGPLGPTSRRGVVARMLYQATFWAAPLHQHHHRNRWAGCTLRLVAFIKPSRPGSIAAGYHNQLTTTLPYLFIPYLRYSRSNHQQANPAVEAAQLANRASLGGASPTRGAGWRERSDATSTVC